jgi:uncharacterized protein (TIGR00730 family)
MRVCVYGAASALIDEKYLKKGFELGKFLGERGHDLVYGAGSDGMMGASARGFKAAGAHVHGVIPKFFEENGYEAIFYEADKLTFTQTMAERKTIMEDECQAFVITPGGIGTYEEFFQVLTLKQLGRHQKAIVLFNIDGYYEPIKALLKQGMDNQFINDECEKLCVFLDTPEQVAEYIENYSPDDICWDDLKRIEK